MISRGAALALAVVVGCAKAPAPTPGPAAPPSSGDVAPAYRGLYVHGFELSSFRPCGAERAWWVTDDHGLSDQFAAMSPAFVVVEGTVGPEGRFGHMGAYARELAVTRVIEARLPDPGECGASK